MKLTRSRGFSRHVSRDFNQERTDLYEGYSNYKKETESTIQHVLASDEYSPEQKKAFLQWTKADLLQKEQEYREELQRINEAEAQYLGTEEGENDCTQDSSETSDPYCVFHDQAESASGETAEDYCGSAAQEDAGEPHTADNNCSMDM